MAFTVLLAKVQIVFITDYAKLAEFIVDRARETGATDNLTLICVFLRPVEDLWKLFIAET